MAINTLTENDCRKAAPNDGKLRKLFDGHGLFLAVLPSGSKVWRLAYRDSAGRQQTAVIGPYPLIGLKEARERRDVIRLKLLDGIDLKAREKPSMTFDQAVASYWAGRLDISDGYKNNALRGLAMHLSPAIGRKLICDITRDNLMDALKVMDSAGLTVYVRRVRMWAGQVFDWSVQHGYCDTNLASTINSKVAFSRKKRVGFAFLPLAEVHPFMKRLALEDEIQSVLACKFLALTWTRTVEMRAMKWAEIEGDLWRLPGKRMKLRRDHLVPLSRQAQELLAEMKRRSRGSDYVFPNDRTGKRPMSENSVLYLIHRMGYKGKMTGHGWRKVGSTWGNEHEYNKDHIEMQIAHNDEDESRSVYNAAEYLRQRRVMMQDYANWLLKEA